MSIFGVIILRFQLILIRICIRKYIKGRKLIAEQHFIFQLNLKRLLFNQEQHINSTVRNVNNLFASEQSIQNIKFYSIVRQHLIVNFRSVNDLQK